LFGLNNYLLISKAPKAEINVKLTYKNSLIGVLICVVMCLFTHDSMAQNKQVGRIIVENKALSLIVLAIEEKGLVPEFRERGLGDWVLFYVTLRNDYDRPVAVYKIDVWDETRAEKTGNQAGGSFLSKSTFKPGQIIQTNFLISPEGKAVLTTSAVIFEDGTGDGDTAALARLQEERRGVGMAYQKLVPILRDTLNRPDSLATRSAVLELKDKLYSVWPDKCSSEAIINGFYFAKSFSFIFYKIEEAINSGQPPKTFELLSEKLAEMEWGLKEFTETAISTPVKR